MSTAYDLAVESQVQAEQLKTSQSQEAAAMLTALGVLLAEYINKEDELADATWRYKVKWLKKVKAKTTEVITKGVGEYEDQMEDTTGAFAGLEALGLLALFTGVKKVNKVAAFKAASELPMGAGGQLVKEFVKAPIVRETNRIIGQLRMGLTQGKSNKDLITSLRGTKKLNYRDGIIVTSKRNLKSTFDTATQHLTIAARMKVWDENLDIVKGYEWASVLDNRTSSVCRSLDGQQFQLGKGPIPPAHMRCRSTIYALIPDDGVPDTNQDYYGWLKGRSARYQDSVLGPTRGRLLRNGGLTAHEFADLNLSKNFKPMTLDQMRRENPEAFELAGV